jgi:hypothetical protein
LPKATSAQQNVKGAMPYADLIAEYVKLGYMLGFFFIDPLIEHHWGWGGDGAVLGG